MIDVTTDYFSTEAEALDEIAAMGWNPLVRDIVLTEDEPLHWHDFESVIFIVSGSIRFADAHGAVTEVQAGSRFRGLQTSYTANSRVRITAWCLDSKINVRNSRCR